MLRKLPGLIWTIGVFAFLVKRFAGPEPIKSITEALLRATGPQEPVTALPDTGTVSGEVHTPLPVA